MALNEVEQKILGRLAKQVASSNEILSTSLYQVLGLSISLVRRLEKARRNRTLDRSRNTPSLQLYYQIIWLAREGLSITEVYILPYSQNGEQGPECRVMAAKLRASFFHVLCLYHNDPPINQLTPNMYEVRSSLDSISTPILGYPQTRQSPTRSPGKGKKGTNGKRKRSRTPRDPTGATTPAGSYFTPAIATGPPQTPPPAGPPPPIPTDVRQTPTRPPGFTPIEERASRAAATFLLASEDFVTMAREHFENAQNLASKLLRPAHALRLSLTLEHAAFLRDCAKEYALARRLARKTVRELWAEVRGVSDEEFADASSLATGLTSIARSASELESQTSHESLDIPELRFHRPAPLIDRTIATSPTEGRNRSQYISNPIRSQTRTPERLSTVPEVESTPVSPTRQPPPVPNKPTSSRPSRSRLERTSTSSTQPAAEQTEWEPQQQIRNVTTRGINDPGSTSRHPPRPQEGYVTNP